MGKENKTEDTHNTSKTNTFTVTQDEEHISEKELFEEKLLELFEVMCKLRIGQDKSKYWKNYVISDSFIRVDKLWNSIYTNKIPRVVSYIYKPCAISNEGKLIEISKNILDILKKINLILK